MKAAVMIEPGIIEVVEKERPVPKEHEVLVKNCHVGLCGSDLTYYSHGRIGDFVVEQPIILGHEVAGTVVEVGPKVTTLRQGDLVALEPGITCGKCEYCKTGRYNLCPDVVFLATPPYDGAFVEYLVYPEDMCFKLSEGMDTIEGALIEPLAVGFHAAQQGEAQIGQNAVVLGAGCIGLMAVMALRARGIAEIYVTDVIDLRLKKAKEIGATQVLHGVERDVVQEIMALTGNRGVDLVIESAGSEVTAQQTVELVKRGGTIVMVGMSSNPVYHYDFGKLQMKEAKIANVFRYRNIYPMAISAVANKIVDVKQVVTNMFGFSEIQEALEFAVNNKSDTVKIVIDMEK